MKKTPSKPNAEKGMPAIHQKTVERLAHGLKPVEKIATPLIQWFSWLVIASLVVSIILFFLPLRADLLLNLKYIPFDLMMLFIFVAAALSALGAIEASFPGGEQTGKWKFRLSSSLGVGVSLLFFLFFLGKRSITWTISRRSLVLLWSSSSGRFFGLDWYYWLKVTRL